MREMSHRNLSLLIDIGQEGAFVVDAEIEDTVLIGEGEGGTVDGTVGGLGDGFERETVEGGEH